MYFLRHICQHVRVDVLSLVNKVRPGKYIYCNCAAFFPATMLDHSGAPAHSWLSFSTSEQWCRGSVHHISFTGILHPQNKRVYRSVMWSYLEFMKKTLFRLPLTNSLTTCAVYSVYEYILNLVPNQSSNQYVRRFLWRHARKTFSSWIQGNKAWLADLQLVILWWRLVKTCNLEWKIRPKPITEKILKWQRLS